MGERQVSVRINAPPEVVFGLYTDAGRVREWLSGVREVRTAGPTDQPGGRAVMVYRWPFKMAAEVLEVERPARHVQGGTELRLGMAYRVAGGPIGRVFDSRVGDDMITTNRRDLARLKALAEEQAGIRRS
jgi:hypothetical protein